MGLLSWLFGKKEPPEIKHVIEVRMTTSYDKDYSEHEYDEEIDPDKDAWEGSFWDAGDPVTVKATLELTYIDGNSNETKRVVDVSEFDKTLYGGIIIGRCHLRNATRTFRFDRIQSCVDVETGEEVSDVRAYLQDKYNNSPEATLDTLLNSHRDMLRALLFIGKADGRLIAKERTAILNHAIAITGDERLDDKMLKKVFRDIEVPSLMAFKRCCGRVAKALLPEERQRLISTAEAIVASEKTVHPAEQEALDYIRKRLNETK